jgi:DNA modification methylase
MTPYYEDGLVTIYHGDCREIPLLELGADAVVTDPPYGVEARARWHGGSASEALAWDRDGYPHGVINELAATLPVATFGSSTTIARELEAFRPTPRVAIWAPRFRLGLSARDGLAYRWHPLYLFGIVNPGATVRDVFDEPTEAGSPYNHPSAKPLGLMRAVVAITSGVVLDPYAGSGTTLRAAKDHGRPSIGVEREERYCELAARRCSQGVLGLELLERPGLELLA